MYFSMRLEEKKNRVTVVGGSEAPLSMCESRGSINFDWVTTTARSELTKEDDTEFGPPLPVRVRAQNLIEQTAFFETLKK